MVGDGQELGARIMALVGRLVKILRGFIVQHERELQAILDPQSLKAG